MRALCAAGALARGCVRRREPIHAGQARAHRDTGRLRWVAALVLGGLALGPALAAGLPVARASWFDASARLPFEQVREQEFAPVPEVSVGAYAQGASWWRVTVPVQGEARRLWAVIEPSYLDDVQVYDPSPQGGWRRRQQGDRFAFQAKDNRELVTAFDFEPRPGRPLVFYVRLQTTSLHAMAISVLPEAEFRDRMEQLNLGFGAYAGATLLILLLCLWRFGQRRERLWLVNALLQLTTLLLALGHFGYLPKYLVPDWPQGIDRLTTVLMCTHNFMTALYYALLARRLQACQAWQRLLLLPLLAWPVQMGLLAAGHTTLALQFNFLSALCGSLLGLASVCFFRIEDRSLRRAIRGLYLFQAMYLLLFMLPLLGLWPMSEWHLYPALLVNLVTALTQYVVLGRHEAWREAQLLRYQGVLAQERELRALQQQRLEESASLIGMLLHEIKNPLALIRLALHNLVRSPMAGGSQALGSLGRAQQAVDDIDAVLEHCQQADRLEAGRAQEASQALDLVRAVAEQVQRHPGGPRMRLAPPPWPLRVRMPPSALAMVIRNLLDNALHYSVPDTPIEIALDARGEGPQAQAVLRVGNQLLLADLPDADQLFNKYYRGRRAHRRTGSGLGLFLVKELLKQAGGSVVYRAHALALPARVEFEATWPLEGREHAPLD